MPAIRKLGTAGLVCAVLAGCSHGDNIIDGTTNLVRVSGEGQFALPGAAVPESLVVLAVDGQANPVAGVAISWTGVTGGGSVFPAATATDANGRLAARWTLGSLGANGVTATAGQSSVTFHATATNTPPTKLGLITQPTSAQSGVVFSTQPVVEVQDNGGTPVPQAGATVTASIATGSSFGALGGNTTAVTAANGRASFSGLKLTGPVGSYTLRFSASGLTPAVSGPVDLTTVSGKVPLIDMGSRTYLGFTGGLFANGSNTLPAANKPRPSKLLS